MQDTIFFMLTWNYSKCEPSFHEKGLHKPKTYPDQEHLQSLQMMFSLCKKKLYTQFIKIKIQTTSDTLTQTKETHLHEPDIRLLKCVNLVACGINLVVVINKQPEVVLSILDMQD